jgi:hypothetical protein
MAMAMFKYACVVLLLISASACSSNNPSPSGPSSTPPTPTASVPSPPALPPTNFPALSGLSRTFTFDHELPTYRLRDYTKQSRFILYDNGAFALKYASLGIEYRGGYTESNGVITFQWEGWSTAGAWGAIGTLADGSLTVQYNLIMQLSDFEDAVYAAEG